MLVKTGERVPLARLLTFLELGERLAHDCAKAQASIAPELGMQRFLRGQARQEGYHATIFHAATRWLVPRGLGPCHFYKPLEEYRQKIESALHCQNFAETLLAQLKPLD